MKKIVGVVLALCCGSMVLADESKDVLLPQQYFLQTENYPPYNFSLNGFNFARNQEVDGVAVRIVREMFERAGIDYSITLRFPWSRVYKLALEKPGYGVFATAYTAQGQHRVKWVGPISSNAWVAVGRSGRKWTIKTLEDLNRYKVGGYKGDATTLFLQNNGIEVIEAYQDVTNVKRLRDGDIDIWVGSIYSTKILAKEHGVDVDIAYVLKDVDLYLAMNLTTPDRDIERLQQSLDKMQADGSLERILQEFGL